MERAGPKESFPVTVVAFHLQRSTEQEKGQTSEPPELWDVSGATHRMGQEVDLFMKVV